MKFEEKDFKELYIAKYGEKLDWDNLHEFAQYVCQEQKEDIIDDYRRHSTSMDGTEYVNRNFIESVGSKKSTYYSSDNNSDVGYQTNDWGELDDDDQNIF